MSEPPGAAVSITEPPPITDTPSKQLTAQRVLPLRRPGRWIATAVVLVLAAQFVHGLVSNPFYQWDRFGYWFLRPTILDGLLITLEVTAYSAVLGLLGGVVLALARLSKTCPAGPRSAPSAPTRNTAAGAWAPGWCGRSRRASGSAGRPRSCTPPRTTAPRSGCTSRSASPCAAGRPSSRYARQEQTPGRGRCDWRRDTHHQGGRQGRAAHRPTPSALPALHRPPACRRRPLSPLTSFSATVP